MAVNEVVFEIAADARSFLNELKRVQDNLAGLQSKTAIPVSTQGLKEVKEAANEAKTSVARLSKEKVNIDTSKAKENLESVKASAVSLKETLKLIATSTIFAGLVHGAYELGKNMIEGNAQFEKFQTTLEVMLGSADKARDRMQEYAEFAKTTPFELPQVVELGNKLQALGRYSIDTMRTLGDLAAASGKPIEQVTNAFAKLSSGQKGVAVDMFRDLLITTEDWVKATGKGVKATGELEATAEEMIAVLPKILEEKGFAGMMEKQSQTFEGIISNIKDTLGAMLREMGKPLFDTIKSLSQMILDVFSSPIIQKAITDLGTFIGSMFSSLAPVLSSLLGGLLPVVTGILASLQLILQTIIGLVNNLLTAVAPVLSTLGSLISEILSAIAPFLNILTVVFASIFGILANILDLVLKPLVPLIREISTFITPIIEKFMSQLQSMFSTISEVLNEVFSQIAPILSEILITIFQTFTPLIPVFAEIIGVIWQIEAAFIKILAPVIRFVLGLLQSVAEVLVAVFQPIAGIISELARQIGEILSEAMKELQPVLDDVSNLIREMAQALLPVILDIVKLLTPLLGFVAKILATVGEKILQIAIWTMDKLIPVFNFLVKVVRDVIQVITDVVKGISSIIQAVEKFFGLVGEKKEAKVEVKTETTEKKIEEVETTTTTTETVITKPKTVASGQIQKTKTEMQKLQEEARKLADEFEKLELRKLVKPEQAEEITARQKEIVERYKEIQEKIEGVRKAWNAATKSEKAEEDQQKRLTELKKEYIKLSQQPITEETEKRKIAIISEAITIQKALNETKEAAKQFETSIENALNPKSEVEVLQSQLNELKKRFLELSKANAPSEEINKIVEQARQINERLAEIKDKEDVFKNLIEPAKTLSEKIREANANLAKLWVQWENAPTEEKGNIAEKILAQKTAIDEMSKALRRLQREQRALLGETTLSDIAEEIKDNFGKIGESIVSFGGHLGKSMETLFASGKVSMKKFGNAMLASVFDSVSQIVDMYAVSIISWFVATFTPFVGFPLGMAFVGMLKGLLAAAKPKFAFRGYMKGVIENEKPHPQDTIPVFISPDEVVLPARIVKENRELIISWLRGENWKPLQEREFTFSPEKDQRISSVKIFQDREIVLDWIREENQRIQITKIFQEHREFLQNWIKENREHKNLVTRWLENGNRIIPSAIRYVGRDFWVPMESQKQTIEVRTALELEMSPLRASGNDLYSVLQKQNVRRIRRL